MTDKEMISALASELRHQWRQGHDCICVALSDDIDSCGRMENCSVPKPQVLIDWDAKHWDDEYRDKMRIKMVMRLFYLNRLVDNTGVSGTGHVACGVQFPSGKCVMSWLSDITSIAIYDSVEDLITIHGHNGNTVLEWENEG